MLNKHATDLMRQETYKRERKKELSRQNCRTGYEYNEVTGKCVLPYAAVERDRGLQSADLLNGPASSLDDPMKTETSTPRTTIVPDDAISAEKNKRLSAKAQKSAQASKGMGGGKIE